MVSNLTGGSITYYKYFALFQYRDNCCFPETEGQVHSSIVIDHPLAVDTMSSDMTGTSSHTDMDNRVPRDSQNNPISMNVKNKPSKDYGECLTLSDHDRLRIFIHEFMVRGLLPWAERTLRTLNEQVVDIHVILLSFTVDRSS